jgi:lysozyme family protein
MKCPQCREEVTEGSAFCWACEAPLDNLLVPPAPARPATSGKEEALRNPQAGKNQEILALAVFMMGLLWSCGATVSTPNQVTPATYTLPALLIVAGVLLYFHSRVKRRREEEK